MPYVLLAVQMEGGLPCKMPKFVDVVKGLAQLGEKPGQEAVAGSAHTSHTWYHEQERQEKPDLCSGIEYFLTAAEKQLMTTDVLAERVPWRNICSAAEADLRSLHGMISDFANCEYSVHWVIF